jgi:hypothetical protein
MVFHKVRVIESFDASTERLFELGLSFGVCKRKRRWPSLATINSFLGRGVDDGALATDIEWKPCTLTQQEYEHAVTAFMRGEPFTMDTGEQSWDDWFAQISHDNTA